MRRRTGIVIGACAALVLTGSGGAVAWTQNGDRPVGTWHEGPGVARTQVAAEQAAPAAPGVTKNRVRVPQAPAETLAPSTAATVPESATAGPVRAEAGPGGLESAKATSRQRVGELLSVRKLVGYLAGPKREKFS